MKTTFLLLFIAFKAAVFAQVKDKVDQINVTIEPYKHATNGAFYTFLSLTCSNRGVEYIGGFDFEWGYKYELKLKRTKLAQPMEDAGDTDYDLIKVVSKTKVADSTTFKTRFTGWVQLSPNNENDTPALVFNEDGTCTFLGGMVFYYDASLEEKLKALNKTDTYKMGTYMFLDGKIHLIKIG